MMGTYQKDIGASLKRLANWNWKNITIKKDNKNKNTIVAAPWVPSETLEKKKLQRKFFAKY